MRHLHHPLTLTVACSALLATGCDPVLMAALQADGKAGGPRAAASALPGADASPGAGVTPNAKPSPRASAKPKGTPSDDGEPAADDERPTTDDDGPTTDDETPTRPTGPAKVVPRLLASHWEYDDGPEEVLARVNAYRAVAGLPPVRLDKAGSEACELHSKYLVINRGAPEIAGLLGHVENPALPGYTERGAEAGAQGNLHGVLGQFAVDGWMNTLWHRNGILDPQLTTIAYGHYPPRPNYDGPPPDDELEKPKAALDADGYEIASTLWFKGRDGKPPADVWPQRYPVDGQDGVPSAFEGEVPDPRPAEARRATCGYPITLRFGDDNVTGVSAALTQGGAPVAFWLSSPEAPTTKDPLQPDAFFRMEGTVLVLPKQPLEMGKTYGVRVTATWGDQPARTWKWSFTVDDPRITHVTDPDAIFDAIGR